jgi:hypothetical protein
MVRETTEKKALQVHEEVRQRKVRGYSNFVNALIATG